MPLTTPANHDNFFSTNNKIAITTATFAVAMIASIACRPSDKEEPLSAMTTTSAAVRQVASCDTIGSNGSCSEYVSDGSGSGASSATPFNVERTMCRSSHGDFATKTCSSIGRVGTCDLGSGEVKRYYAASFNAETARLDCEERNGQRGKFVALK